MSVAKLSARVFIGLLLLSITVPAAAQNNAQQDGLDRHIKFAAEYQVKSGTRQGVIMLSADIASGNHIYALKQDGTMPPSKLSVVKRETFALSGQFKPDSKPIVVDPDPVFQKLAKHKGKVVFWVPFELSDGADVEKLDVELEFNGTVCSVEGMCFPIRNHRIRAIYTGEYDPELEKKTAKK